jgi:hypothetical protein
MKALLSLLLGSVLLVQFSGCASLFGSSKPESRSASEERRQATSPVILEKKSMGVEVTWEVPSDSVDGFVIRYGQDKTQLKKEVTILLSELRLERDSQYGPVYRYVIQDITSDQPIYVSIAAFKGETISDFSEATAEMR